MELLKGLTCSCRGRVRNRGFSVNKQSFCRIAFSEFGKCSIGLPESGVFRGTVDLRRRGSYSENAMRSLNLHHGHHHHHHAQSVLAAMSGVAK
jgi:hypothetical protein